MVLLGRVSRGWIPDQSPALSVDFSTGTGAHTYGFVLSCRGDERAAARTSTIQLIAANGLWSWYSPKTPVFIAFGLVPQHRSSFTKEIYFFYHNTFGELLYVDNSMFLKHFHVLPTNKKYIKKNRDSGDTGQNWCRLL